MKTIYYIFAEKFDQGLEKYKNKENVTFIHIDAMPWPLITLLRFRYFLSIENELKKHDFLMFTNANIICDTIITAEEFLPDESKDKKCLIANIQDIMEKKLFIIIQYDRNKK